jgi:glycine cleavage system aminomethyltransferase T
LKKGIAMAYVKSKHRDAENILEIVVNGKIIRAEIIKPPFVKKGTC